MDWVTKAGLAAISCEVEQMEEEMEVERDDTRTNLAEEEVMKEVNGDNMNPKELRRRCMKRRVDCGQKIHLTRSR